MSRKERPAISMGLGVGVAILIVLAAAVGIFMLNLSPVVPSTSQSPAISLSISSSSVPFNSTATATNSTSTVTAPTGGRLYEVIFKQTGDCTPTIYAEPWSVTLGPWTVAEPSNSTLPISTAGGAYDPNLVNESTIIFSVPNGQYSYRVSMGGWNVGNPAGVVRVNASDVMVLIQGPLVSCTVTTAPG